MRGLGCWVAFHVGDEPTRVNLTYDLGSAAQAKETLIGGLDVKCIAIASLIHEGLEIFFGVLDILFLSVGKASLAQGVQVAGSSLNGI